MKIVSTKNILLVDDNQNFLNGLADSLRECEGTFCVLTAENGDRALKVLESAHVDLVVTDLKMPVMDGFGLLSNVRRNFPEIPVIIMSSFLCPEVETGLRNLGALQCIDKCSISALRDMIVKVWQGI